HRRPPYIPTVLPSLPRTSIITTNTITLCCREAARESSFQFAWSLLGEVSAW
ncbi:hypothetical protein BGX30_005491, partial [Mortierella sp. GBA39]